MMKKVIIFILLLSQNIFAQSGNVKPTVFKQCLGYPDSQKCTAQKLKHDIQALITPDIVSSLQNNEVTTFNITTVLILNENGEVIPEQTEVICDFELVKNKIINYYINLPAFATDQNITTATEKRFLYFAYYTFIYDNDSKIYKIYDHYKPYKNGMQAKYFPGIPPHLKDCKGEADKFECSQKRLFSYIVKKGKTPKKIRNGNYKIHVSFAIMSSGKIEDINISDDRFKEEFTYLLKTFEDFIPASIHGIPYSSGFSLPVTINVVD